jgi:hypothetical protein
MCIRRATTSCSARAARKDDQCPEGSLASAGLCVLEDLPPREGDESQQEQAEPPAADDDDQKQLDLEDLRGGLDTKGDAIENEVEDEGSDNQ